MEAVFQEITAHLGLELRILGAVALAMVLGGALGFERERADKPAGLRTHMLVAGAAALLVGLGRVMLHPLSVEETGFLQADPIRILEAVITGVSFLGAGTIIQRRRQDRVEGLTTAASLLFTAGIGSAVALARVLVAVGATVLGLITLRLLQRLPVHSSGGDEEDSTEGDPG